MAEPGAEMRKAFVTGWPLTSTRSPLIHNAWIAEHGLDAVYEAVPVPPEEADVFLRDFTARGYVGGNVTMPHKERAAAIADRRSATVERLSAGGSGSANTLWSDGGAIACDSTDGHGFAANLDENAPGWDRNASESTVMVLGAGGAALAVVDMLAQRRFGRILIANRTGAKAQALATRLTNGEALAWNEVADALPQVDLLVNTTALGMKGSEPSAHYPPDLSRMKPQVLVNDLVYVPLRTPLLEAAGRHGLRTVDGLGMLLHQAAPGFERWFGIRPCVTARLRRRVVRDLGETEPVFLGLTGSIGMGKSTTAAMFLDLGVPVHDADATVHGLYAGAAAPLIEAAFPGTTGPEGVDRDALRRAVVGRPDAMKRLEGIVHPMVRAENERFRRAVVAEQRPLAVLDIPLLFETGGDARCEAVVTVTAPPEVQRERVLARGTMSEAEFEAVLARQVPDAEKRARSDFVVDTSQGMAHARSRVSDIVAQLSDPDWLPALRSIHRPASDIA